jgi:secondary thiamine-phosphate synthase enzyme
MRQAVDILSIPTRGRGLVEITRDVLNWLKPHTVQTGLLTLFCRHTSAGLLIQENAARDVRADLETFFDRLAPEDASRYRHADEGPDDMPAHIRTALVGESWRFPFCRGSSRWELGKVFTCSSIGVRRISDRLPCILLVNRRRAYRSQIESAVTSSSSR